MLLSRLSPRLAPPPPPYSRTRFRPLARRQGFQTDETENDRMGGGVDAGGAFYDAALQRRKKLMGASGARALLKNFKVFRIAAFACIGGVLYGYNQGMFSGLLAMDSFKQRTATPPDVQSRKMPLGRRRGTECKRLTSLRHGRLRPL